MKVCFVELGVYLFCTSLLHDIQVNYQGGGGESKINFKKNNNKENENLSLSV